MFPNESGGPIDRHNLMRRHFIPTLKAAGLPRIRFHDLRHSNASIRLEEGQNIKYISTQLGHANPTITLNTYSHLIKGGDPEAASRLEKAIIEPTGSRRVAEGGPGEEDGATVSTVTP
jgi:integrase